MKAVTQRVLIDGDLGHLLKVDIIFQQNSVSLLPIQNIKTDNLTVVIQKLFPQRISRE